MVSNGLHKGPETDLEFETRFHAETEREGALPTLPTAHNALGAEPGLPRPAAQGTPAVLNQPRFNCSGQEVGESQAEAHHNPWAGSLASETYSALR